MNATTAKRGQDYHDPAYKYDYIYDTFTKNVNFFTKYAKMDLCGELMSWAHWGYGKAEFGLVGCVMGKPGMTRGDPSVIISDVIWTHPWEYIHHYKKHTMHTGWI
jgi:hypothetical protein